MNKIQSSLEELGIQNSNLGFCTGNHWFGSGNMLQSVSPVDGKVISSIQCGTKKELDDVVCKAHKAFMEWRNVPAPQRGEIVRQIGNALRKHKNALGTLVSYEMGKIYQEGLGEVQEMIDICDFAVGQSRMLYGMTTHSERPEHRMYEQWHPLGVVGVISAFNFPVAVWAWNAMLALICGDVVVWKPSSKVMVCAVAVHNIVSKVLKENDIPEGILNLVCAESKEIGDDLLVDRRIPLISATGSTRLGKYVGKVVGERLGKTILELGGNNAIIVSEKADLDKALNAIVFGAVGTAGQRCTSTRRLIVYDSIYDILKDKLVKVYNQLGNKIGNPLEDDVLIGPLIDVDAVNTMQEAIKSIEEEGGKILIGGQTLEGDKYKSGCFVMPAIAEVENSYDIVQNETFAPILYIMRYDKFEDAIAIQNDVPQGLSSSIFTENMIESEIFLSAKGSDCGIANVNIGTSGAEIGGAFGGEKETGGGRESGSDSWKIYMRRQTNTINYGSQLTLAQGIRFDL